MIRLSIRRPVAVTMAYATVSLLGVAAWSGLPVELLPNTDFPRLSIQINWPGASPETIEAFATSPVEGSIQQIRGVERLLSTSRENSATLNVEFARGTDMDFVRMELAERIATLEEELPPGVQPLIIQPWVPPEFARQAQRPFLRYTLTGPFLLEALRMHLEEVVQPEILQVQGVSSIVIEGGRNRLLEVELDPDLIAALGLRPEDVQLAISSLDIVRDAGSIREGDREWAMTIRTRPATARDIREAILPVPLVDGVAGTNLIRVEDVAVIRDTFEEPTSHYRINGLPTIGFRILKEDGVNTVRLAEEVKALMEDLAYLHPPGSEVILVDDQSEDINREIADLRTRAGIAAIVIFLVLFLFLRSFRTAATVFATIAFSILITLNLIYFGGFTLNLLTLMGLALGFGLIVDNSIVVQENIYRRWQEGDDPYIASEKGAKDVVLPIIASTATTLIVLIPFVYLRGELRIMYLPLAIVVGLTLIASLFVSFSFIPALAARALGKGRRRRAPGGLAIAADARTRGGDVGDADAVVGGDAARALPVRATHRGRDERPPLYIQFYMGLLDVTLRFPWATVAVVALCCWGSWWLFDNNVTRGQIWGGGFGQARSFIQVTINMPRGQDLERVDALARHFEERLDEIAEIEKYTTNVLSTRAQIRVDFPPELEFTAAPLIIEEQLRAYGTTFTGASVSVIGVGQSFGAGGGGSAPNYRIVFLGYNYDRLAELAEDFGRRIGGHARVQEVDTNASGGFSRDRATEFVAFVDRDAAARFGITVQEGTNLILSALRGTGSPSTVVLGEEPVRFEVKLAGYRHVDVQALLGMVVATSRGTQVPIGDLVRIEERRVLTEIRRENQQYERTVAYEFRGPAPLGNLVRDEAIAGTYLPPGYSIRERTQWMMSTDDARQFRLVLLVALGLIIMVTAALFESIRQPLCILLSVPMALIGVALIFVFLNATFTREAYIGVIMTGGIIVNNAILLVDQINRVREETTLELIDAIVKGTLERVRPILMTSAVTIFGLLPLVLFTRTSDSTIWNALTYTLIGGLSSSTLLVLTTAPALYLIFERGPDRKRRAEKAALRAGAAPDRAPATGSADGPIGGSSIVPVGGA